MSIFHQFGCSNAQNTGTKAREQLPAKATATCGWLYAFSICASQTNKLLNCAQANGRTIMVLVSVKARALAGGRQVARWSSDRSGDIW